MTDELVRRLRERTTLRYMGGCKCGFCQLVHVDDIYRAADRIEALMAERQWQPIETAPMGVDLPVWCPNDPVPSLKVAGFYQGLDWLEPDGTAVHPTHWMPLPAPPAETQK